LPLLRQNQPRLNTRETKYIFVNGVAGVVFSFDRPKQEYNSWKTNKRDEQGNFIKTKE